MECPKPDVRKLESAEIQTDVSSDFSKKLDCFEKKLNGQAYSGFQMFTVFTKHLKNTHYPAENVIDLKRLNLK